MYKNNSYKFNNNNYNFYKILDEYYKNKYNKFESLENIHKLLKTDEICKKDKMFYYNPVPIFGLTDRNSVFIKDFYKLVDTDYSFLVEYLSFIKENIKPLFNNERLMIQKTPNIRFHLPGCSNIGKRDSDPNKHIIGLHSDSEFNHPESEMNIVLPITKMYDTNSIFYEPYPNSKIKYEDYESMNLEKNNFFCGYLNKCNHYNKINQTKDTRVSLDFRVIPFSKFKNDFNISATSKKKFILGDYYMIF